MKVIMVHIVTLLLVAVSIKASNAPQSNQFMVTQLALDAVLENNVEMKHIVADISENEENITEQTNQKEKNNGKIGTQ